MSAQIDDAVRRAAKLISQPEESQPSAFTPGFRVDYSAIDAADAKVREAIAGLYEQLPQPPTIRGRVGNVLIRLLRKAFWWQSYQIRGVLEAFASRRSEELEVIERIGAAAEQLDRRLARLEAAEIARQSLSLDLARLENPPSGNGRIQPESALAPLRSDDSQLQGVIAVLGERVEALESQFELKAQADDNTRNAFSELDGKLSRLEAELEQKLGRVSSDMQDIGEYEHRTRLQTALLDRRMTTLIREARSRVSEQDATSPPGASSLGGDLEYWQFEAAFRGTRDEILDRQRIYLPLVQEVQRALGSTPILDLGCGRGEWLELLRDAGFVASGIDCNEEMLADCRSRGLNVERSDALERLRATPSSSHSVVTAFHLVEHLPIAVLVELIDETARVLKPGGICLFETPNPANIMVATQGFYLDPTHVRPLPSPLLRYLVEARGFCNVYCEEVNPYPEWAGSQQGDSLEARFNRLTYGPRDYAVIGRKA